MILPVRDISSGTPAPAADPKPAAPPRLEFLDGLRGIAAFYVVIHHASQIYMGEPANPPAAYYRFFPYLILGHYAVVFFLVMSGFCLMLPVARSKDGGLRGGFTGYFGRRIKRIVPPYYAAIILSLLLILFLPSMQRHDGEFAKHNFPGPEWTSVFEPGNLISHALVLHALSPRWINTIDSPLWSVGIEWITYFLMPLVLLPIWRRFGNVALIFGGIAVAFLPYATIPLLRGVSGDPWRFSLHWAHPWFIALFALGMAGAAMQFPNHTKPSRRRFDDALLNVAVHPVTFVALGVITWTLRNQRVPVDFMLGFMTMCVIVHCVRGTRFGTLLRRPLESKVAMALGAISYSLYLIHAPLLLLMHRMIEPLGWQPGARLAFMLGVATPTAAVAGTVFYFCFERPFLSAPAKAATAAELKRHSAKDLPKVTRPV